MSFKTTRYFDEQVQRKRPYLRDEWIEAALGSAATREVQLDGRVRLWRRVEIEGGKVYWLRIVVLKDGETVHNAFFDRDYKEVTA